MGNHHIPKWKIEDFLYTEWPITFSLYGCDRKLSNRGFFLHSSFGTWTSWAELGLGDMRQWTQKRRKERQRNENGKIRIISHHVSLKNPILHTCCISCTKIHEMCKVFISQDSCDMIFYIQAWRTHKRKDYRMCNNSNIFLKEANLPTNNFPCE